MSLSEPAHPGMRQPTETLLVATQDSRDIIALQRALARIWRDGYLRKAGIAGRFFRPRGTTNLFDECAPRPDSEALMNAVDRINAPVGRIFAGQGFARCAGKC
ncbi:hypothetical protein [Klebsiella pneumoniae]|uniref:hypothetical protein n=1 Tax=Klebsiella pneumoniae TaxID=573 RepID=UPI002B400038|nr:hypothetical protein [Klebsiella pneumoniae]